MNEIVWAYDYGARTRSRWPAKHDSIPGVRARSGRYVFRYDAIDRIPYLAPKLVTPEKARARQDAHRRVVADDRAHGLEERRPATRRRNRSRSSKRIVKVHSESGDVALDFFAGSGTTGEAAAKHGRGFVLIDEKPEAVGIMAKRLARFEPERVGITRGAADPATASPSD